MYATDTAYFDLRISVNDTIAEYPPLSERTPDEEWMPSFEV